MTKLMNDNDREEFEVDQDTTAYLLGNKCNAERLMKSIAQIKEGNIVFHELIEDASHSTQPCVGSTNTQVE